MVEESETPGYGPEGRGRPGESDFLAERRARRATETGEAALQRRAEAAEATVETLERHVASLQQRLEEAEAEQRRAAEHLDAERAHGIERESELRRVKQREYAEQQLRVEAEDRLVGADRETREESRRLGERLGSGERQTRELSERVEALQRQLGEAEQAAAAERSALRRAEQELEGRVRDLERRAEEIQQGLLLERGARERAERELAGIREGHRRMEGVLADIRAIVARLGSLLSAARARPAPPPPAPAPAPQPLRSASLSTGRTPQTDAQRGAEMAEALAAAVERLRARAQSAPMAADDAEDPTAGLASVSPPDARTPEPAEQLSPASEAPLSPARHKHSQSLIARVRNRRKQRRGR